MLSRIGSAARRGILPSLISFAISSTCPLKGAFTLFLASLFAGSKTSASTSSVAPSLLTSSTKLFAVSSNFFAKSEGL
ncbi:hypothetical protein [Persephonella sp.]|uniref:hypothetical protein n=1 Tax=Persephonella sp. TaxID=2060922 RepID=UPI0026030C45|nr:hypothetical protein [Persephonella sp.]